MGLTAKLPASLREEVEQYKRQITEVKVSLHNSEARRYNALIRSTAFDEPLRPLLLPLMSPAPASGTTAVTSASPPSSSKTPIGASATPELTPLIPSPLFPLNLSSLISMEPSEARALVKEYGLIKPGTEATITDESQRQGKKASAKKKQDVITESSGASREDDLNRFMKFIG
ncbi:hypothetical protein A0H81_10561 [Grifola frondosa]|uniref:Uncharacterized protein n=1 Tax=Grifola frondosa TaxID=5627 RepID=A0A1C7LYU1_GRIFR|nr:hypothetical protein A0H81_10561 [Grifola frondosa]